MAAEAIGVAASPGQGQPWQVAKFYATAMPRSVAVAQGLPPYWVPDDQVTTEIDGTAYLAAKTAAMRAHATQIAVDGGCPSPWPTGAGSKIMGREYYTLLAGGTTALEPPGAPMSPGEQAGRPHRASWPGLPGRIPVPGNTTCSPGWTGGEPPWRA